MNVNDAIIVPKLKKDGDNTRTAVAPRTRLP